ncbi:hypothetical protein BJY01DRAFT_229501 [Aspergillus pseudoustus]|uniref:Uncharacterized protein n=1 Tax=Aspergillus pseudoustus TaxID=1810923 RepID=A0ABR4IGN7_9EURO
MDERGYSVVTSRPNPNELPPSIGKDVLNYLASSSDEMIYADSADHPVAIKKEWQKYMEDGINLDVNLLVHFKSIQAVIWQGPIIYSLALPSSAGNCVPRKAHPCPSAISIWKPAWGMSLLKVYPGSHKFQTIEELQESEISPVPLRLYPNQVLFTRGGLWVEEGSGAGYLMWMGASLSIIGLHIDMHCLSFIARAYGATQFLLRREPAVTHQAQENRPLPQQKQIMSNNRLPNSRSETGDKLLAEALIDRPRLIEFFKLLQDPTGLILRASYHTADDIRAVECFMHVLRARRLAQRFYSRGVSIVNFIEEEGLPNTTQTQRNIRLGKKLYCVELAFGFPGIWLALMTVLPRFDHLPNSEVDALPQLLREQSEVFLTFASDLSSLMDESTRLYGIWVEYFSSEGGHRHA